MTELFFVCWISWQGWAKTGGVEQVNNGTYEMPLKEARAVAGNANKASGGMILFWPCKAPVKS